MLEAVDAKKFVLARSKPGRPCGVPHPRPPFSGRSCIEYSVKHFLCGGPLAARYKCLRSTTEQASLANKESGGCVAKYKVSTIVEAKDETDAVDKTAGFLWSWAKMYQLVHPALKTRAAGNRLGSAFSQPDNRVGGRVMAKLTFSGVKITKLSDGDLMFFMCDRRPEATQRLTLLSICMLTLPSSPRSYGLSDPHKSF